MLTRRDGHTPAKLDPPKCWLLQSLTPGARWQPQSAGELGIQLLGLSPGGWRGSKDGLHIFLIYSTSMFWCAVVSEVLSEYVPVRLRSQEHHYGIVASLIMHFLPFPFFTFSSLLLKSSVYHPNKTLPWKFFLWSMFITSHTLHHFSFIWNFWQVTST